MRQILVLLTFVLVAQHLVAQNESAASQTPRLGTDSGSVAKIKQFMDLIAAALIKRRKDHPDESEKMTNLAPYESTTIPGRLGSMESFPKGYVVYAEPFAQSEILSVVEQASTVEVVYHVQIGEERYYVSRKAFDAVPQTGKLEWIFPSPEGGFAEGEFTALEGMRFAFKHQQWNEVVRFSDRFLTLSAKAHVEPDLLDADALLKRAQAYAQLGLFKSALTDARRARELSQTFNSPGLLAESEMVMGDALNALDLPEQAVPILEALAQRTPEEPRAHALLAVAFFHMDALDKSLEQHLLALSLFEKEGSAQSENYGIELSSLGKCYEHVQQFDKAVQAHKKAAEILGRISTSNLNYAMAVDHAAGCLNKLGDYDTAKKYAERALQIYRTHDSRRDVAIVLGTLARACEGLNERKAAIGHYEARIEMWKRLGANQGNIFRDRSSIADLVWGEGDPKRAHGLYAELQRDIAKASPEQVFAETPSLLLQDLAVIELELKNFDRARQRLQPLLEGGARRFTTVYAHLPEETRFAIMQNGNWAGIAATLRDAYWTLAASATFKGVVEESLARDQRNSRNGADVGSREALQKLTALRRQLQRSLMEGASIEALDTQRRAIDTLEFGLSRGKNTAGSLPDGIVLPEKIAVALHAEQVLCDYVLYARFEGAGKWRTRYAAVSLTASGKPVFHDLGSVEEIDSAIGEYLANVNATGDPHRFEEGSRKLYQLVVAPLASEIKGRAELIIVPDGTLQFVSFASLLSGDGRFLSEAIALRTLTSARDLLSKSVKSGGRRVLLLGNPDYSLAAEHATAIRSDSNPLPGTGDRMPALLQSKEDIYWPSLPGTENEVKLIDARFRASGWNVKSLLGAEANEVRLAHEAPAATIVHLATHGFSVRSFPRNEIGGFQLPETISPSSAQNLTDVKGPLLVNGLCLAGANSTFQLWKRGKVPEPGSDGVLLAGELASLNLNATELFVTSACDTGKGEARAGQGVVGLRYAVHVAGAENMIYALWEIPDEATANFMADFYDLLLSGKPPAVALSTLQRTRLAHLRQTVGAWKAAREVGAFVCCTFAAAK